MTQNALDPLAALLKGAGLRRSEPDTAAKTPAPKKKTDRKAKARSKKAEAKVSPLAVDFPNMPIIPGVRLTSVAAGIRYRGRRDLMVATMVPGTTVAGVFTQSKTASAPVEWCRKALDNDAPEGRVLVVNSGNSNAFTGRAGDDAVKEIAGEAARAAKCRQRDVFIASTGVIGEPLAASKISSRLPTLIKGAGTRA